jgi:hypothetical protein
MFRYIWGRDTSEIMVIYETCNVNITLQSNSLPGMINTLSPWSIALQTVAQLVKKLFHSSPLNHVQLNPIHILTHKNNLASDTASLRGLCISHHSHAFYKFCSSHPHWFNKQIISFCYFFIAHTKRRGIIECVTCSFFSKHTTRLVAS